jgi:hypothetical protein
MKLYIKVYDQLELKKRPENLLVTHTCIGARRTRVCIYFAEKGVLFPASPVKNFALNINTAGETQLAK